MKIHQIDKIKNYVRLLWDNRVEVEVLFKELLIGVTNFFRDPEAFKALAKTAFPHILDDKSDNYTFRAWLPGCSTGEEAYSTAILFREYAHLHKRSVGVQIFATDIDNNAINTARIGIYPASISADVSPDRLERYFISEDNLYRIKKDIREMVVFAPQDIIKDPPFTKLDLVCCRNLLIYLDAGLQKKLLPLFHYSLKPGGILFLGTSETIGGFTNLFAPVDTKWKIFKRKETPLSTRAAFDFSRTPPLERVFGAEQKKPEEVDVVLLAQQTMLEHYAPPCVIINAKGEILYIHGRTGKYLEPAPGEARLRINEMARDGLKLELPSAIHRATTENKEVVYRGLEIRGNGNIHKIDLIVRPILSDKAPSGLI